MYSQDQAASQTTATQDQLAPAADNTKTNQRDRNENPPTADQQKDNRTDRDLAEQIRKATCRTRPCQPTHTT